MCGEVKERIHFLKFPHSTIMWYNRITNSYATLYVHVDFALSARASYWTIRFFCTIIIWSFCCFTEQITKFTFHLHKAKAYRLAAKRAFCVLNKMLWGHDCLVMSCTQYFVLEYFCLSVYNFCMPQRDCHQVNET